MEPGGLPAFARRFFSRRIAICADSGIIPPVLNPIWLALVLLAVFIGGFTGNLNAVTEGAFASARDAVMVIALPLVGMFALWLGIMRLAELSGLVQIMARGLRPITRRLFPDVPEDHPAIGSMAMNIAANMLGIGNAATPLGLRAMRDLETLNPRPGVATNAMCTFLAINTSSVQLIPTTAIAIMVVAGSRNPTAIIGSAFLATICSTIVGITAVKLLEKLPAYRLPPPDEAMLREMKARKAGRDEEAVSLPSAEPLTARGKAMLWAYTAGILLMYLIMSFPEQANAIVAALHRWSAEAIPAFVFSPFSDEMAADLARHGVGSRLLRVLSMIAVPVMLSFFPLYAWLRGIKVYEEFVEGAKEGFQVAVRIIPFLVAILVAVRMFREAGGISLIAKVLGPGLQAIGFPVDLLPLVLVRPLSGGATTGIFTDIVQTFGPDHMNSLMAGTIFGSTETTFYVIAVYFGAVTVKRTRHAIPAGLAADFAGVVASIIICRVMFG